MPEEYVAINIPKKLHKEIQKRVKDSKGEFKSVQEYAVYVLSEIAREEETEPVGTPQEEAQIKERLKTLGYL